MTYLELSSWTYCRWGLHTFPKHLITHYSIPPNNILFSFNCSRDICLVLQSVSSCNTPFGGKDNLSQHFIQNQIQSTFSFCLLKELTCWASDENEEKEDEMKVSTMTLLEVEEQQKVRTAQQEKRLALLQVLAMMVECLHHTVLLRKCTQVRGEIWQWCANPWLKLQALIFFVLLLIYSGNQNNNLSLRIHDILYWEDVGIFIMACVVLEFWHEHSTDRQLLFNFKVCLLVE